MSLESRYVINVARPEGAGKSPAHFFRVEVPMYSGREDQIREMIAGFEAQWPDAKVSVTKWEISGVNVNPEDL